MKKIASAWSGKKIKFICPNCKRETKHEIIQYQNKINIGPIPVMGKGPREFGIECNVCHNISKLPDKYVKNAEKMKYYAKRPKKDNKHELSTKSQIMYPVMTNKEREKIIRSNKKEGLMSAGLALFFGAIVSIYWKWGIVAGIIFALFGIYAMYEDPERKFRDLYRANVKIK